MLGQEDKVVWHLEQKSRVVYIEILICTYSEQLSLTIFPSLIANTHIAATGFYVQGLANVLDLNPCFHFQYLSNIFEQNGSCRQTEHHLAMATELNFQPGLSSLAVQVQQSHVTRATVYLRCYHEKTFTD